MKSVFLFFLLLSLHVPALTQIVWEGNSQWLNIARGISFLEDPSGHLEISQIGTPEKEKLFQKWDHPLLNFGFTESTYWLKFSLENHSADSLFLELGHAFIPEATLFYQNKDGSWNVIRSGYKVPLKVKAVKDHFQLFPLPSGVHNFFIRFTPYLHPITVKIWNSNAYQINANRQRLIFGIYTGILFFAIAINIFLFFFLKKIYYFLYALLVLLYVASAAGVMEGYLIYFFPSADLMYWYKIIPVLDMPVLLLYCLSFLEIRRAARHVYNFTLGTVLILLLYIIALHFLPMLLVLKLNQLFALLVFILAISLGIIAGRKGNKLGYYFAITYSIWFVLLSFEEIYIQLGQPKHLLQLSYVSLAIFIEAFLLAFLQAKRFQWERKEDERTKFEMQKDILLIQQKFQKEIMQARLEMQEQTFHTISQEIHDNIGQTLSLVKLNLNTLAVPLPDITQEKLNTTRDLVSKVIYDLRNLAKTINTDYIRNIGLTRAIEQQLNILQKTDAFTVHFSVKGVVGSMDPQKELLIFRIVQELLNNVIKHSNARMLTVEMNYNESNLQFSVTDNGKGFDWNKTLTEKHSGLGLQNIINRISLIKGTIIVKSAPGKGTEVIADAPYR
jgi:two-component system, NtrC family, sensor kinase